MAFERRRPDRRVVYHSDRGAVYTLLAFWHRLADLAIAQSFGSTGDCYDNAAVEAVWATLKRELSWIYGTCTWPARSLLRTAIFDYIEGFYNTERIQLRLGYLSQAQPAERRQASAAPVTTDHSVEAGVGVTVTDQDEPHHGHGTTQGPRCVHGLDR